MPVSPTNPFFLFYPAAYFSILWKDFGIAFQKIRGFVYNLLKCAKSRNTFNNGGSIGGRSASNMSRKVQVKKQLIANPKSAKLLNAVSFENGFHFYTTIGNYTGMTATSLSEFAAKLQIVPGESITFHFQRKDFEKWIEYTIKDVALSERISKTNGEQPAEDLRKEILKTVETRIPFAL